MKFLFRASVKKPLVLQKILYLTMLNPDFAVEKMKSFCVH
jgi:hypothetical protein